MSREKTTEEKDGELEELLGRLKEKEEAERTRKPRRRARAKLKTSFADASDPAIPTESKPWKYHASSCEYPSSIVWYIDCPFCGVEVKAYLWSLSGGGKRCECGAIFGGTSGEAHRRIDPSAQGEPSR